MIKSTNAIYWGIMGCGKIAHKFAQDLLTIPNAVLSAVASRDLMKAKEFGALYDASTSYGNYEKLTLDPKVDVIYIATPHVFHYKNTLLCLRNKKAVLCEKPFAMNTKQVTSMIDLAKKQRIFLMEALWTYFLPHYRYALELINTEALGKIRSLTADFGFIANPDPKARLYNKDLGGGSLLDVGVYPLFAALTFIGFPDKIKANAYFSEAGIDTSCKMKLIYENGTEAFLFSAIDQQTDTAVKIDMEKGSILIHGRFHQPSSITVQTEGTKKTIDFPVTTNGYNYEAMHVMEMLRKGKTESSIMTFERSIQLISLLDRIREEIGLKYESPYGSDS